MPTLALHGHPFFIPARYSAGHPLLPSESVALESLRLSRIRNQLSRILSEPLRFGDSPENYMALAGRVSEYDEEWEFRDRPEGRTKFEQEILALGLARFGRAVPTPREQLAAREAARQVLTSASVLAELL